MTDLRQSLQFGKYSKAISWKVEKISDCQVFIRKLPFIGSIIKIQRPNSIFFKKIDELAKKYQALFVKLEPVQPFSEETRRQLYDHGFCHDSWPLLASKTIWIDLTKSKEKLWQEIAKDTRYCIRKAKKEDIKILRHCDIESFYNEFKRFGKGYIPKKNDFQALVKSFGKNAILLSVNDLAGALILIHGKTAYYYYAFTSPLGRKKFAQPLLVLEAIKLAKTLKCHIFDLEGIEDSRYKVTRKWHGFSRFKKSFGGREVEFPGSFSKYYHPIAKLLFQKN
ncbi:peptidoglycan bridge formation glycyltransferase FemA/FemB family protein [Candidatus Microgenomates bacterium]|nr:peptidoglycan bridge formation glycyltransferase FemA/FemB family protein [Candidatus Microgenomates bacterium]